MQFPNTKLFARACPRTPCGGACSCSLAAAARHAAAHAAVSCMAAFCTLPAFSWRSAFWRLASLRRPRRGHIASVPRFVSQLPRCRLGAPVGAGPRFSAGRRFGNIGCRAAPAIGGQFAPLRGSVGSPWAGCPSSCNFKTPLAFGAFSAFCAFGAAAFAAVAWACSPLHLVFF